MNPRNVKYLRTIASSSGFPLSTSGKSGDEALQTAQYFRCLSGVSHREKAGWCYGSCFSLPQVLPYWLAQFLGAFGASAMLYGVYYGTCNTITGKGCKDYCLYWSLVEVPIC